jgi:hypothetical protein
MNNITLYHITSEQLRINELLEESGGELTPEIEEALVLNEHNFVTKSEGYIQTIAKYQALVDAADNIIKEAQRKKRVFDNISKRLKERLQDAMIIMGRDRVEVGIHTLSLRNSVAVNITEESKIPNEFIKVETSVDKMKVKEALKRGELIPGAELQTNQSIQIR